MMDYTDVSGPSASVIVQRGPFEMIPHWLLDADVGPNALRLYLVLRRHGNRDDVSFPGRKRLAQQMHVSVGTVDNAKAELISVGALCQRGRVTADGDPTSNEYHVHWDQTLGCTYLEDDRRGWPNIYATPTDFSERGGPKTDNLTYTHSSNLDTPKRTGSAVAKPTITEPAFDEFWAIYPRKVAKGHAVRAWNQATRKESPTVIMTGAVRYRDDPNREDKFTAHPATWLNGERWNDDPLPESGTRSERKASEVEDMIGRAAARDAERERRAIS